MKLKWRLQRSNSRAKAVQRVFEDYSRRIALTVALRLYTVATRWTLFATFNTSLATCYSPSALGLIRDFTDLGLTEAACFGALSCFLGTQSSCGVRASWLEDGQFLRCGCFVIHF